MLGGAVGTPTGRRNRAKPTVGSDTLCEVDDQQDDENCYEKTATYVHGFSILFGVRRKVRTHGLYPLAVGLKQTMRDGAAPRTALGRGVSAARTQPLRSPAITRQCVDGY